MMNSQSQILTPVAYPKSQFGSEERYVPVQLDVPGVNLILILQKAHHLPELQSCKDLKQKDNFVLKQDKPFSGGPSCAYIWDMWEKDLAIVHVMTYLNYPVHTRQSNLSYKINWSIQILKMK
jgi:hypothetical protein